VLWLEKATIVFFRLSHPENATRHRG